MIRLPVSAALVLGLVSLGAIAQEHPPEVLLDQGACPFECCQYGQWTTTEAMPAFAAPDGKSRQVALIPAGTVVIALTGQVRTKGGLFVVNRAHEQYKPGDTLRVYTYHGEGHFTVWYKGRRFIEDLGFSPYGGTGGKQCTDSKYCWGSLTHALQSQWWAKIRLADGRIVWVRGSDGFEGQDACG